MNHKIKKYTPGDILFSIINYTVFISFAIICIFPFYFIFINTISANYLVARGEILFLPRGIHFNNYARIFTLAALPRAAFISLSRTVLGTFLSVMSTAFVAYAVTRPELFMRKFCYRFFLITMYFQAGLIPWFLTMRMLGLTNSFWAYIIAVISPFHLILIKTYIESTPASLQESAEMDGAGYLTIFFRILLPLCKPILATVAVFTAVGQWNAFMDTLFLVTDSRLYTLQFILWRFLSEAQHLAFMMRAAAAAGGEIVPPALELTPTSVSMTITMVVVLPILFVYPFFQRYFVKGIMLGAVKG